MTHPIGHGSIESSPENEAPGVAWVHCPPPVAGDRETMTSQEQQFPPAGARITVPCACKYLGFFQVRRWSRDSVSRRGSLSLSLFLSLTCSMGSP